MRPKGISMEKTREIAAKFGFKIAGPDHPVYKEGPTIMFVSRPVTHSVVAVPGAEPEKLKAASDGDDGGADDPADQSPRQK